MISRKTNALCVTALILSFVSQAVAQVDGDQRLALSPIRMVYPSEADSAGEVKRRTSECDNNLDGAIIGGLIGGSPAILALVLAGNDDTGGEKYIPLAYVGFLGGIAGFFIGLGVDSGKCSSMTLTEVGGITKDHNKSEVKKLIVPRDKSAIDRIAEE